LLGLNYYKLFIQLKDAKKQDIQKIKTYISQNPNIVYNTEALGGFDFEIEANFKGSHELAQFISNLKEYFPTQIKEITPIEYIKEHKVKFYDYK